MRLLLSPPEPCGYLGDRDSSSLFVDPLTPLSAQRFSSLLRNGFRRSGQFVYRPHCAHCQACVPVRVPVARFQPNRSQLRNWKSNLDLDMNVADDRFRDEHYALYLDYQHRRHRGGPMSQASREDYSAFLTAAWAETLFVEFRDAGELIGVAVTDTVPDGLSAVYTFFSAAGDARGLGKFAVLWQIDEVRRRGQAYVYLGYWIEQTAKMNYKKTFRPVEALIDRHWTELRPRATGRSDP